MKKWYLSTFLLLHFLSFGQNINKRNDFKDGFGLKIGGPTFALALNYNHFFNQNLNLELGAGIVGAYGGLKYFFGKEDKVMRFTPYVGAEYCYTAIIFDGFYQGVYLPLGVQFFSKKGFNLSLEASCFLFYGYGAIPWGSLHIGKNF